jgi:hypothetical protein
MFLCISLNLFSYLLISLWFHCSAYACFHSSYSSFLSFYWARNWDIFYPLHYPSDFLFVVLFVWKCYCLITNMMLYKCLNLRCFLRSPFFFCIWSPLVWQVQTLPCSILLISASKFSQVAQSMLSRNIIFSYSTLKLNQSFWNLMCVLRCRGSFLNIN